MIRAFFCLLLLATGMCPGLHAQSGAKGTFPKPAKPKAPTAAPKAASTTTTKPAPKPEPAQEKRKDAPVKAATTIPTGSKVLEPAERRLETLLLMPEPRAMRTPFSIMPAGAQLTVLTPYRESVVAPNGIEPYTQESFAKLGLGVETFAQRAKLSADKRLMQLRPELIKGEDGKVAYAVYRGDSPLFPTLLIAPSLPQIFEQVFGKEIWVAMPDRHSLYVFPANADLLQEFGPDLADRYTTDPFAASCEVFSLKAGEEPKVIASFVEEP